MAANLATGFELICLNRDLGRISRVWSPLNCFCQERERERERVSSSVTSVKYKVAQNLPKK